MKKKKLILLIISSILLISFLAVNVSAIRYWKDTDNFGRVYIELKPYTPSLFADKFAAYFVQSSVYPGEQADITDVWTNTVQGCLHNPPYSWVINIFKNNIYADDFGEMADYAEEYQSCTWLVTASFATTEPGTYTLNSQVKATSSSSYQTFPGTNSLTVINQNPTVPCAYGGWQEFLLISNGRIDWNPYRDLNSNDNNYCTDKDDLFKTSCNSGYHISGMTNTDTWADGQHSCIQNINTQCDYGICTAQSISCTPGTDCPTKCENGVKYECLPPNLGSCWANAGSCGSNNNSICSPQPNRQCKTNCGPEQTDIGKLDCGALSTCCEVSGTGGNCVASGGICTFCDCTCCSGLICNPRGLFEPAICDITNSCVRNCSGKVCGTDGCGGSCGTCASGKVCGSNFQCISSSSGDCTPACTTGQTCISGYCVSDNGGATENQGNQKGVLYSQIKSMTINDLLGSTCTQQQDCQLNSSCESLQSLIDKKIITDIQAESISNSIADKITTIGKWGTAISVTTACGYLLAFTGPGVIPICGGVGAASYFGASKWFNDLSEKSLTKTGLCIKSISGGFCFEQANTWLSPYTKSNDCQTNTIILIVIVIGGLVLISRLI